jgi:hypothetical protein
MVIAPLPSGEREVYRFKEGLARVGLQGGYGFMDKTGNLVISASFKSAEDFAEGLAAVFLEMEGKSKFIDKTGKIVTPLFDAARSFSEGLAPVKQGDNWGFIDASGRWVISPIAFDGVENSPKAWPWWRKGKIRLHRQNRQDSHCPPIPGLYPFAEGRPGSWEAGGWGYLDRTGKKVIPAQFLEDWDFSNGLALVELQSFETETKYAFINPAGKISIRLIITRGLQNHPELPEFCEGLAPVEKDGKVGFIDVTGKFTIPPRYSEAKNFAEGLAPVGMGRKLGYIDKTGKFVWPPPDEP